jgi:hypothetical protein
LVTTTEPAKRVVVRVVAEHDDPPIGKLRSVEANAFDDPSSEVTVPVPEYEMSARP